MANSQEVRYKKGVLTPYNLNILQLNNPTSIMWWSVALPGFGHIILCKYLRGFLLIVWEFTVNVNANLNTAIYLTFTGQYMEATQILDKHWALLYAPVYLFSIWDSRRVAIELNSYSLLADKNWNVSQIPSITIAPFENNYLERKKTWVSVFWSAATPGLGQIYINRLPSGFFLLISWLIILYFSNTIDAINYSFTGDIQTAAAILNPQWVLFIPSFYLFAIYDAYVNCNGFNKLYTKQQSYLLIKDYQHDIFKSSTLFFSKEAKIMNIVASFKHSTYLELALDELERYGIPKQQIFAIPLTEKRMPDKNKDIIRGSGLALLDVSFVLGTICSIFGIIYGFVLPAGPVYWGLIGLAIGLSLGFLIDLGLHKREYNMRKKKKNSGEVMLIIHCSKEQLNQVKQILFDHYSVGLQVLEDPFTSTIY